MSSFSVMWFHERAVQQDLSADCCVVIDLFRTSSFIVTALALGAREIVPAKSTKESFLLRGGTGAILAGERKTESIKGFDMNNSPTELLEKRDRIKGRTIVHRTSAGTRVLRYLDGGALVGCALNASAVRKRIEEYNRVSFVCCGLEGREFALEDFYGVRCITEGSSMRPSNDFALLANRVREADVRACSGARRLREHGYEKDIDLCLKKDLFDICPSMREGRLTLDHS